MLAVVLAGWAKAINPAAHAGDILLTMLVLCGPGLAWTGWPWHRRYQAGTVNPARLHELARQEYGQRASRHQQSELARLDGLPEWGSAEPPARRTDVFGGTLVGWRSLLAVHGASILAQQPLLVADLSGQYAAADLAGLARAAGVPSAEYLLPRDLDRSGLLTRLAPGQLASALAEAIHAGTPGSRADRAIDVRVLEHMCTALRAGGITPARLAAAAEVALGHPESSLLTSEEAALIRGSLLGEGYRSQISANLIRLDAFLSGLGRYTGTGQAAPANPAWCTFWLNTPGADSAHAELLDALIIQWLTVQVSGSAATTPAVIIASADHITRDHLERLAAACEHRGVHLTLLFRHMRDDATAMIGGGTTAFMRLGNHQEAEQAASFLGHHHKFVLSGFTATLGGSQSRTDSSSYGYGAGESRGSSVSSNWADDHLFDPTASGSRTRSRDHSTSENWSNSVAHEQGKNWSDAASIQRVYEYRVEPSVLQHLPDHALLLANQGQSAGVNLQVVESSPAIINLPHVSTRPLSSLDIRMSPAGPPPAMNQADRPQLAPRHYQPQWPPMAGNPADAQWLPRRRQPWPQSHQQPPEHHD
jgi:hypothetical protein